MEPPAQRAGRPPPNLAAIVGDNIVPVAGVLLLQWSAANLVVLYFAEFLVDIAACLVLLAALDPDRQRTPHLPDTPAGRVKGALGIALGILVLLAVFAFAFGMPVAAMVGSDPGASLGSMLADRGFALALALQVLMAARGFLHIHRGLARRLREDPSFPFARPVRKRFAFVTSRWVAVFAASFFLAIPTALVIAYCAASIWYEIKEPR